MKLRIKGQSLRLRVARSEVGRLLSGEGIEETIRFSSTREAEFTYALTVAASQSSLLTVHYMPQRLTVVLSKDHADKWGSDSEVGLYRTIDIGPAGLLEVSVEKDFACLDRNVDQNEDTFVNPLAACISAEYTPVKGSGDVF